MTVLHKVRHFFLPTRENVYRPPLLGKTSLILFLALTMAVEGFLVAGLVAQQSDGTFLSQAQSASIQNTAALGESQNVVQSFLRQAPRIFDMKTSADWMLGLIALILIVGIALAFFFHPDVQAHDMLLGGTTVAMLALVCLVSNVYIL